LAKSLWIIATLSTSQNWQKDTGLNPYSEKSGLSKSATDFDTYKVQPWINDLPQGHLVTDLLNYVDAGAMALAETNEQ